MEPEQALLIINYRFPVMRVFSEQQGHGGLETKDSEKVAVVAGFSINGPESIYWGS